MDKRVYKINTVHAPITEKIVVNFEVIAHEVPFFDKATYETEILVRTSTNVLHPTTCLSDTGVGPNLVIRGYFWSQWKKLSISLTG